MPALFNLQLIIEEFNIKIADMKYFCGHSLGEYSALVSIGSLILKTLYIYYMKEEINARGGTRRKRSYVSSFRT